ncbi:hypothetical protein DND90_32675 [Pseudomonas syringae pv. maculicola]|nr:hypothetical protein DND90_32675 [Pseudomonas syringae pv. maculicola]
MDTFLINHSLLLLKFFDCGSYTATNFYKNGGSVWPLGRIWFHANVGQRQSFIWRSLKRSCIGISKCLCVAACNRNGLDLQSSHFSTGINCVYPSQQTEIICE